MVELQDFGGLSGTNSGGTGVGGREVEDKVERTGTGGGKRGKVEEEVGVE